MHRSLSAVSLFLPLAVLLAGCGTTPPPGPPMATVKGNITFDGTPIDKGTVEFHADGSSSTPKLDIKNGAYEGKTPIGLSTVVINTPDGRLPARYNTMPSLQRDVKDGDNEFNFELKSK